MSQIKEPIAITGIGCRTPGGVQNPQDLWRVLIDRVDGISTVPADRWNAGEYYDPNPEKAGKIKTNRGGFIDGIDLFDNEFFGIFPKEAASIDPQQRLLLLAAYEAIEDAGDTMEAIRGSRTAVYMGVFMNDYWDIQVDPANRYGIGPHVPMGSSLTSLANRISYLYDFHGPSVSIDTACSSSLVSVHLACQSIWRQEADAAMAGGVNIMINPESTVMMSKGNFLSPDGACKSFDEKANGYVRAEGVGVIYLKPLSKALADGNRIYGLIRGTACNSDGYTPEGFTVPSATAQTEMLRAAYRDAAVSADRCQYLEAHGTGTPVGDPLETRAFANVFGQRPADRPLLIGSVKSNVGHLEGAAGVTGLIKLALCLQQKRIPGNLHFQKGNPKIDFEAWRLRVVSETIDWPEAEDGGARLGGVNSFGAGGTNAHVVIEEYVPRIHGTAIRPETPAIAETPCLFQCGARTEAALRALLLAYKADLAAPGTTLEDVCYNAGKHRSLLTHRISIVANSNTDLMAKIDAYLAGNLLAGVTFTDRVSTKPKVGFVFTGQGPQWFAMGRELIAREPVFRDVVERIEGYFQRLAGWSLLEELNRPETESKISDTRIAQPAIMAIQIALVELWKAYGVEPDGVIGHSIGEVAAAYTAGALTLPQAVEVIYHRSKGQHRATGKGVMLAAGVSLAEARTLIASCADRVSIAAVNGPESVTLSGDEQPLRALAIQLEERDIFHRMLQVNVPFHSHHMEPLKEELISSLAGLTPSEAKLPLYSTVTGRPENGLHLVSEYWYDNVREPVYFSPALERMLEAGFNLFVEIGPHPALSGGAEELFQKVDSDARIYPSMRRREDELLRLRQTAGALSLAGVTLAWDRLHQGAQRRFDLPRYPWQLKSFWNESRAHREHRLGRRIHPHIVGHQDSGLGADVHAFNVLLDRTADPYVDDHRVDNIIIFPATGHLEIATAAARKAFGDRFQFLEDVNFASGLFLPDEGEAPEIRLEIYSDENRYWLMSRERGTDTNWTRHSNGRMNCLGDRFQASSVDLPAIQARINDRLPVQPMYNQLKQSGLYYGTAFRAVHNLWTAPGEILGKVQLHESLQHGVESFLLHPAVLDACLHTIFAAKMTGPEDEQGVYLPIHIDRYKFHRSPKSGVAWSYVRVTEASAGFLNGDFVILDEDGAVVAEVQGLRCKYIGGSRKEEDTAYSGCYEYRWQEAELAIAIPVKSVTVLLIDGAESANGPLPLALEDAGLKVITLYDPSEAMITAALQANPDLDRVLITLPLDYIGTAQLAERTQELSWKMLQINRAIVKNEHAATVWTLLRRAEQVTGSDGEVNLAQSPVFGLMRVLNNELPAAATRTIDMDSTGEGEWQHVAALVAGGTTDAELALRAGKIYAKRLGKVDAEAARQQATVNIPGSGSHYEAFFAESGILDSVRFRQTAPHVLGAHEVEIAVKAAGLNFKDVLNGMGLLPAESVAGGLVGAQLGLECAGVVTRTGRAVKRVKIGDAVLAIAPRSIAGIAVTPEHCVARKPAHLSFEDAATLTIVYLTAYHCLLDLANLESGERLLIHSGTGGVGIAAIRLAQFLGAEIYATAGSESKRALLREMGVRHVYDSRTLEFHDQIMRDTAGEGVDVVLNSLSGKAIVQSLKCLRPFGRFVEIGKTDIYEDAALYLKRFGENLSYFAVDVDRLMAQKPVRGARLFDNMMRLFAEARIAPHPYTAFPVTALAQALDFLSKGKQIGKVVLRMEGETVAALPAPQLTLHPEKSYIITGGASGFGIELAKWLAERGAKKLVLASRGGPKSPYDEMWIDTLSQQGVQVMSPRLDLSRLADVQVMVDEARRMGPVGGVIHGAAVLQDCTIENLTRSQFEKVFQAKALGGWNLHQALGDEPVNFFLMLSSISSVFGLPGQSNYSAANNFLDGLVQYRRTKGLSAQSVDLGVLGQYAGMSKEGGRVLNVLANQGWLPLTLRQVTAKIEQILLEGNVVRMAANIDWQRFREFFSHLRTDSRFAHLLTDEALNLKGRNAGGESLRDKLHALAGGEAEQYLTVQLTEALARILGTTPDKIDASKPVSSIGLDSLMMNQLRNWILRKLEVNYPLMRMAKGPSIAVLAAQIREELAKSGGPVPETADASGITSDPEVEIVNRWFVKRRSEPDAAAKTKLIMFHSMGASASMFGHFLFHPPPGCEVYCVQLPGRENRAEEAPYSDLKVLLDELEPALLPLLDGPFAIYGHSFGGIIAFEVLRMLRRKYGKTPVHFFASATMAPQLTLTWKNRDVMRESTISSNSEQKLIGLMSYIDDLDFVKKILPGMRRDMPLLMGYDYQDELPLSCPITVFSAIEDEVTLAEEMTQWEAQTSSQFRQELVHGDHWFVSRNKDFIGLRMAQDLAPAADTSLAVC